MVEFGDVAKGGAAVIGAVVALRKGTRMIKVVMQVLAGVLLAVAAVEMDSKGETVKGEEKKAQAVAAFGKALDPVLPDWMNPVVKGFLGFLIDQAVAWANRTGFFAQLAVDSSSLPLKS